MFHQGYTKYPHKLSQIPWQELELPLQSCIDGIIKSRAGEKLDTKNGDDCQIISQSAEYYMCHITSPYWRSIFIGVVIIYMNQLNVFIFIKTHLQRLILTKLRICITNFPRINVEIIKKSTLTKNLDNISFVSWSILTVCPLWRGL